MGSVDGTRIQDRLLQVPSIIERIQQPGKKPGPDIRDLLVEDRGVIGLDGYFLLPNDPALVDGSGDFMKGDPGFPLTLVNAPMGRNWAPIVRQKRGMEIQEPTESRDQPFPHDLVEASNDTDVSFSTPEAMKPKPKGVDIICLNDVLRVHEVPGGRLKHERPTSKSAYETIAVD